MTPRRAAGQGLSQDSGLIQCNGNYKEMKKINYMLEIDIFKKFLTKIFACPEGCFLRVWVSKRHPDALLA